MTIIDSDITILDSLVEAIPAELGFIDEIGDVVGANVSPSLPPSSIKSVSC